MLGYADDAIVTTLIVRSVIRRAGTDAVERRWRGTPDALAAMARATGMPLTAVSPYDAARISTSA